ncbi:MAG: 4Fe-4S dicluster domain-containing protein [Dehalococcoidales bacterium]|nr:4Fe-4S dicluster domain-containing protein [Dehalococcoidales bacterium]
MNGLNKMDVLIVGGGPASLAAAIKLKQLLNENNRKESVVVIEKADKLGQHNLSGAVFEADVLEELVPDWKQSKDRFIQKMLANRVERDELTFLLTDKLAIKIPEILVPSAMRHKGNYTVSVSELVNWLGDIARSLGVEMYTGFAGREIVVKNGFVAGVKLGDKGLDKEGEKQSNYIPGETLEAKVTVFGDGSLGMLSDQLVKEFNLNDGRNPQVYSVGVKEIIKLPETNNFGNNRVIHTIGFPNKLFTPDIFGGGTMYSMGDNTVALSLILSMDWRYYDLNPQRELQVFKSHNFVKRMIKGGEVVAYGAKTLPEGGYYSIPELVTNGAILVGDAAGLVNVKKLKGLHYAIKSGIVAGETIFKSLEHNAFSKWALKRYEDQLKESFVMKDLEGARNYRQVFAKSGRLGIYMGAPLTFIQQWLPFKLGTKPDYEGMTKSRLKRRYTNGIDRLTAVSLSGTNHREEQPSHITILDPTQCIACGEEYGCHPCESFCSGEVYKFEDNSLMLSPSNCLHCQLCRVKCPRQNIRWVVPEGGDGPKYKVM